MQMIAMEFTPEQFAMLKRVAEENLTDLLGGGLCVTEEEDDLLSDAIDIIVEADQSPRPRFCTLCENHYGEPFHYFASSLASWKTGVDLDKLIADMKREGFPFNVFRVDLPETAGYKINMYRPQVAPEKLHHVGFWEHVNEEEPV